MILFVSLNEVGSELDQTLVEKIKSELKLKATPRHVPIRNICSEGNSKDYQW